ncbi:MAG: threonine synthase [candidate division KSB1 bacterium]|nr:threonine synthase [candidate division KSB1 bacterium]MDZ7276369.1 threonine synthase [candidate division KSB1 bacterium]MDZ7287679.1 threonine synthase [candidate division KSB1 bacterium]MDZ7299981.1 threonine synthase [candidate division KSB1 bacterium]MDZ7307350.1 threonine synthase [candidate division KSB1 bacterium]
MPNLSHLRCVSCNRNFSPAEIDYTCPACGPLAGTLEVCYDYDAVAKRLTRDALAGNRDVTHWRYWEILPVKETRFIQPLAVGGTPLYHSTALAQELGLRALWIKDDGRNPTASLKDRASSVAIVRALERGATTVTAASTGNAASSWSAFTAVAGLRTVIFVPENAPAAKLAQLLLYGALVLQVRGTYDEAFDLCCQAAEKWGWYNRSTAINPYLGEGKKTAALEICEQLHWQVPDCVFVAVGDGCILQGMWKGFKDLHALRLIERLPRMIGVQAQGSAPLVQAWQQGAATAAPIVPDTLADSIAVGVPRDQSKALAAVRESHGEFLAVSDEEILSAMSVLARRAGVFAEPAGATALAGLVKMSHTGRLPAEATAVVMVTGNGLKDIQGVMRAVRRQPLLVENSLAEVERKLSAHQEPV